jgi:hypothetical protein
VDPLPEVRHEVAERADLPALVQRIEALGDAVRGRRDLVGVDRVQLPARDLRIPEHERLPADGAGILSGGVGRTRTWQPIRDDPGLETGRLDLQHT